MPGLFRPTSYGNARGIEYRTVSNLWLQSDESILAMCTNALSMQEVLRKDKLNNLRPLILAQWPQMMTNDVIKGEKVRESQQLLAAVQDAYPNNDWMLGV